MASALNGTSRTNHMLRKIDRFVNLSGVRAHLEPYYSDVGRPSIDPELMIRMLLVGYCYGIRSERRLCDEVHLNLAYRWFCRLSLDGDVPDHSTFSKNRHGRFRDSDLLRQVFKDAVLVQKSSVHAGLGAQHIEDVIATDPKVPVKVET
jgi:transposase